MNETNKNKFNFRLAKNAKNVCFGSGGGVIYVPRSFTETKKLVDTYFKELGE